MGFLDKMPFGKKKEEEFSLPAQDPGMGFSSGPQDPYAVQPPQQFGSPPSYPFQQQSPMYPQHQPESFNSNQSQRDTELLRAKMDAIQATLDSLNRRFDAIEQFIKESGRRRW